MVCSIKTPKLKHLKCSNIQVPRRKYSFQGNNFFCDGKLIGMIKDINYNKITVEHKNGNFADGIIREFYFK